MTEQDILHPSDHQKELRFSDFTPFIHMEGENIKIKKKFVSFLKDLFAVSSSVWNPAGCYATEYLEDKVNGVLKPKYPYMHIEPKSFAGGGHFWLTLHIANYPKELIIDPFGIPTPGQDYYRERRTIIPFFGVVENANKFSKGIYTEGKPLESGVYHIFHP